MRQLARLATALAAATVCLLVAPSAANAVNSAALSWSPSGTYDYGTPSQATSQTFRLTNSGGSGISGGLVITLGGSAFTKTRDTCTGVSLGPKKSCTVAVTYTPTGSNDTGLLTARAKTVNATLSLKGAAQSQTPSLNSVSPAASRVVDLGGGIWQFEWASELPATVTELEIVFAIQKVCPDGFAGLTLGLYTADSPANQGRFVGEVTNAGQGFNYLEGFSGLPVAEPRGITYASQCQGPSA